MMDTMGNGNRVPLVREREGADARALVTALGLPTDGPRPVLVVSGGADELTGAELARAEALVGPAVAEAARRTGAAVVDGGTASGVMALVGRARAEHDAPSILLGVAPAGRVVDGETAGGDLATLEPHHTHFLLADSHEWGGETQLMADAAEALAGGGRIVMVIAGGGTVARAEAAEAERRGWPVVAVGGTGGAADTVDGAFTGEEPGQLARLLAWELQDDPALKDAWRAFATYDALAGRLRRGFERTQATILGLGVLATLLALLHDTLGVDALRWGVVAAPIAASALIAFGNRGAGGRRWVLLRGAAEAIKTQIYRYRTRTGAFAGPDRHAVLVAELDRINEQLMQTDASSGPLTPYAGPLPPPMYGAARDDDGVSTLDAAEYVRQRIGDQLAYYHGKVGDLDRRRSLLRGVSVAAGGVGAILAAAGAELWIGLTTAIGGGALTYLASLQVDATIVSYNQSAARLAALQREWQVSGLGIEELVGRGESVLTTELGGWVQQMNEALEELAARQAEDKESS